MENPQINAQSMLYQFRYLKDQRDMFQGQLEVVRASLSNLINTKTTVENLKNVQDSEEILIPIGGLINLEAKIKKPQKLLLYVSQDVVIEKDLDSSIEYIDKLISQHNEQLQFLGQQIQTLDLNLQSMSQAFQQQAPPK